MDDKRRTYNQAHYAIQKQRSEELKRFKELYPERYAELQAKIKAEAASGAYTKLPERPIVHSSDGTLAYESVPDILKYKITSWGRIERKWPLTEEDIDEIVYKPNKRHVFIHTHDKTYCENIPYPIEQPLDAIVAELDRRHPGHTEVATFELCNCPACLKRHPNS